MKLTTIQGAQGPSPAALLNNDKLLRIDVAQANGLIAGVPPITNLVQIIELDGPTFPAVRALVEKVEAGDASLVDRLSALDAFADNDPAIYAPILQPRMIVSCGMGYMDHLEEMGAEFTPRIPVAFIKLPCAENWNGAPIVLPPQDADMVDYECEFSCVVGRAFHNVSPEDVMQHIGGYTMISDISSRTSAAAFSNALNSQVQGLDFLELSSRMTMEKQYPGFCPIGPVIHTADTFGDPHDVEIGTRLNGKVVQSVNTAKLTFRIAVLLSHFSRFYRFQPGDILTTGSPSGVGMSFDPPRYLQPGDVLETFADRIGTMVNPVVAR